MRCLPAVLLGAASQSTAGRRVRWLRTHLPSSTPNPSVEQLESWSAAACESMPLSDSLFLTWCMTAANIKSSPALQPESRPRRLAWPRTSPFHGGNTGSNPVGDAKSNQRVTRKPNLHRDTQKIHSLSARSSQQLCSARPACLARELGCRCPASSLTLSVATTPALLSHPHDCP